MNLLSSVTDEGAFIAEMAAVFLGSNKIPYFVNKMPKKYDA